MRILAVSTDYPPLDGGIARLSDGLCQAWAQAGHCLRVLASGRGSQARRFDRTRPYPTVRVPALLGLRELTLSAALAREVYAFRPHVVWSAVWFPGAVAASYLGWLAPFTPSLTCYGAEIMPLSQGWRQGLKARLGFFRRRVLRRTPVIFAISGFTRDRLIELGAPASRVQVLPGGVSPEWFQEGRPTLPPTLLTVARLDRNKGHDMVIRALPELPEVRYVIVGPGPEGWPRLRSLAHQLGVGERVEYRGRVCDEQLRELYRQAAVLVMPSREVSDNVEGFGLTFLEAAASGLPAVGGDSGGIRDAVIHERTGLLVDPHSSQAVGQALRRLLDHPQWARQLGEQARQRARDFTWKELAERMVAAWEEVCP